MQCDFELKHMDEVHMVYCRHYGAYTQMQRAFEKLMQWAYPRGLVTARIFVWQRFIMTILKLHLLIN